MMTYAELDSENFRDYLIRTYDLRWANAMMVKCGYGYVSTRQATIVLGSSFLANIRALCCEHGYSGNGRTYSRKFFRMYRLLGPEAAMYAALRCYGWEHCGANCCGHCSDCGDHSRHPNAN